MPPPLRDATEPPRKSLLRCFLKKYLSIYMTCCSVPQSCPTLCDPVDCSMPGFPVLPHFPELALTHVH